MIESLPERPLTEGEVEGLESHDRVRYAFPLVGYWNRDLGSEAVFEFLVVLESGDVTVRFDWEREKWRKVD